jgi:hypothetical protein
MACRSSAITACEVEHTIECDRFQGQRNESLRPSEGIQIHQVEVLSLQQSVC